MSSAAERIETIVGTVVAKKYRVKRLLGAGGMGAVYEAENVRTGRLVAIKILMGAAHDTTTYTRFVREARAAGKVDHPNIVQVLDADQDPDAGTPYIVQEFLRGEDLRRRLKDRGPLAPRDACEILLPVLRGLGAAHAAGIVHRDIKPENIFLSVDDRGTTVPKVIDFGIAKLLEAPVDDQLLTRTGVTLGTPMYMSPEQARGQRDIDAQTDVWAIGVVLYEMLSGSSPFARPVPNATIAAILMDPVDRLDELSPAVPRDLADIVHRAIERNRVRRFQSVDEFRVAIERWMAGEPFESGEVPTTTEADERAPTESHERVVEAPPAIVAPRATQSRVVPWIAAFTGLAALATLGFVLRAKPVANGAGPQTQSTPATGVPSVPATTTHTPEPPTAPQTAASAPREIAANTAPVETPRTETAAAPVVVATASPSVTTTRSNTGTRTSAHANNRRPGGTARAPQESPTPTPTLTTTPAGTTHTPTSVFAPFVED